MDRESQTHTRSQEAQVPQGTQSRKRQIDSDSEDEPLVKRARLTRKNLALFDKMGKKKTPNSTDESQSTKTTSTTSSGFAIQARNNGILDPRSSKPPTNLEDIRKQYAKSRATASPTESEYNDYADGVERARNEATMVFEVGSRMLKKYPRGYDREFDHAFTNFPKDVGFNNGLSAPQPDFAEGLELEEYRPFPVADHVPEAAIYKDDPHSLVLPHIAGEWKGRGKSTDKARLQSAYDGAAMVHARNQALAYMGSSDPPGHAEVTTFTTDGTNLNFYAHYAAPSNEDPDILEYHQYQYASTNVKDTYQGHKDGRKGLRNAQDHAKTQSYALKDQLKEHWKEHRDAPPPVPDDTLLELNADEDEDEAAYEIIEQPCQPTPTASSKPHETSHSHSLSKSSHHPSRDGHKRKAPSTPTSSHGSSGYASKHRSYWKQDPKTGQYYYKHSDGTISWLDDEDDDEY